MGQVIAVVSGKGGTGKTSFTALTGAALASMGRRTLLLDCDVGLRDLDIALGMTDRALMDFSDVISGRAPLSEAAVQHPRLSGLYLLTAPVTTEAALESPDAMERLLGEVREQFEFCLIDAGAGLGESFRLATRCADRVIVVSTTEPSCLRDAQRTVMELSSFPTGRLHLVVNRLRRRLLRSLRSNIDDAMDAAGLPLLGVVPEDEDVSPLLGRGRVDGFGYYSGAKRACRNIARRLCGEKVPLMKL
ncbi:MAG: AAA family ATPase [Oscillospiraceae bacterium]|nr:AAA family ATPase [Oscillospiraceae bacterium]